MQIADAWPEAQSDWQARFEDAFTPGNAHYAGFLPTLTMGGAADRAADRATAAAAAPADSEALPLEPLERTYYHSVISLLANERTNLPVPISGGPCTASAAVRGDGGAAQVEEQEEEAPCSNTLAEPLRSTRLGGLARYLDRFAAAVALDRRCLPDIGGSGLSARLIFTTGGALNTTVGDFYWDPSYSATALALLHPPFFRVRRGGG